MIEFDEQLAKVLLESVEKTFQDEYSLTVSVSDKRQKEGIVACSLELTGRLEGNLTGIITKEGLCKFSSHIHNKDIVEISDDVTKDYSGLLNNIAQRIKTNIGELNLDFEIGEPKVVNEEEFDQIKSNFLMAVKRSFDADNFTLETLFMYKMPAEEPAAEEPGDAGSGTEKPEEAKTEEAEAPEAAPAENSQEPSGAKVILDEVEKEDDAPSLAEELSSEDQKEAEEAGTSSEAPSAEEPAQETSEASSDESIPQPAGEQSANADEFMTDAMKKLDEVIKEIKAKSSS